MKRYGWFAGLLACLALSGVAHAQLAFEYQYSKFNLDSPPPDLNRQIAGATDRISVVRIQSSKGL